MFFTVKKRNRPLAKQAVVLQEGITSYEITLVLDVIKGEELYFDFFCKNPEVYHTLNAAGVQVFYQTEPPEPPPEMIPALSALHSAGRANLFPVPYRGWAAFAYNGNRERAENPIHENELVIDENYDSENPKAFVLVPDAEAGTWKSEDDRCWVGKTLVSSSRRGIDYISVPGAGEFAGQSAVERWGNADQFAFSIGFSFLSASYSQGSSYGQIDFTDMNGDRFPDIVSKERIQYTAVDGSLELGNRSVAGWGADYRTNGNQAGSLGAGGNLGVMIPNARGETQGSMIGAVKSLLEPFGLSLEILGDGSSDSKSDLMDVNGDGLPDRVKAVDGKLFVSLNLGYSFAPFEDWGSGALSFGKNQNFPLALNIGFNTGDYGFGGGFSLSGSSSRIEKNLIDLNGDGLVDQVEKSGELLFVRFNTGSGFAPPVVFQGALPEKHVSDTGNVSLGEGVYFTIPIWIPPTTISIIINPGFQASQSLGKHESGLQDVDGDGLPDHIASAEDSRLLVAVNRTGITNRLKSISRPLGGKIELSYERDGNTYNLPQTKYVLSKVIINDGHEGDGVDTQVITYQYINGNYDRREREFFGYEEVVTERRDPDKGNAVYLTVTQEYLNNSYYSKGLLTRQTVRDDEGRPFTDKLNQYRLVDALTGSDFIDLPPVNLIATVFPQLTRTESYFYEGESTAGAWTYQTYQYDGYGNVSHYFDAGDVNQNDDVEAQIAYHEDLAHYIMGKPKEFKVYGNGALMRHRAGEYDPETGDLMELLQYLANGEAAKSNLSYYANGNLKDVTGPLNYREQCYQVSLEYDPVVKTHITKVTDSFGYASSAEYNLLYGVESSSTDVNGNQMRKEYDTYGRLLRVFAPYDGEIPAIEFFYYQNELPARAVTKNKIYFDPANAETLDTVLFIDGLTRVIQTKKEGEALLPGASSSSYGMNVTGRALFDFLGRIYTHGQPVFEEGYNTAFSSVPLKNPTLTEYDLLGRTTKTALPDGSVNTTAYSLEDGLFKAVNVDPLGNRTASSSDIQENRVKMEQWNRGEKITTKYEYDPLNEITQVIDDRGNATSMTYDLLGRRTSLNNPDSGLEEFVFDLAGNLIQKVDSNLRHWHKAIRYEYEYNRLTKIDYPFSPDVYYFYGEPGEEYNRAGRIKKIWDESGITEFFYGKLGEEIKTVKAMNFSPPGPYPPYPHGPWVFESRAGYDYLGRVQWMIYPDGEKLTYEYDQGGQIKSAYGVKLKDRYDYVKKILYDEFGQRVYIQYGNDVETRYSYDPYRRWLNSINTQNDERKVFQDNVYSFDKVGNVLSLENRAKDIKQSYAYDDLYQLVGAEGSAKEHKKENSYVQAFEYDNIGNMVHKKSENKLAPGNYRPQELNYDFAYKYESTRPHAPTEIGGWEYGYDLNGNTVYKKLKRGKPHDFKELKQGDDVQLKNDEDFKNNADSDEKTDLQFTPPDDDKGDVKCLPPTGPLPPPFPGGADTYFWNEENRLVKAIVSGKTTVFLYNSGGERTVKHGPYGETLYVNQFYQLTNRTEVTKHIFVGTTRIVSKLGHFHKPYGFYDSWYEKKNLYFYHSDHLGSSNYISDVRGHEFEHIEYTPYGETWIEEGTNLNIIDYKFTSKELDEETGLYYFGARYLDPKTSRWMSSDPAMEKYLPKAPVSDEARERNKNLPAMGGVFNAVNLANYHYSNNNPILYIDPDGNEPNKNQAITWNQARNIIVSGKYDTLQSLRYTSGVATGTQVGPFGGARGGRFIYTERYGWIDMAHFFHIAAVLQKEKDLTGLKKDIASTGLGFSVLTLAAWNETEKSEESQGPGSKWSYEDAPSNFAGIVFYIQYYKNDKSLLESLDAFFKDARAVVPNKAPNWNDPRMLTMPDINKLHFPQNKSFIPLFHNRTQKDLEAIRAYFYK